MYPIKGLKKITSLHVFKDNNSFFLLPQSYLARIKIRSSQEVLQMNIPFWLRLF